MPPRETALRDVARSRRTHPPNGGRGVPCGQRTRPSATERRVDFVEDAIRVRRPASRILSRRRALDDEPPRPCRTTSTCSNPAASSAAALLPRPGVRLGERGPPPADEHPRELLRRRRRVPRRPWRSSRRPPRPHRRAAAAPASRRRDTRPRSLRPRAPRRAVPRARPPATHDVDPAVADPLLRAERERPAAQDEHVLVRLEPRGVEQRLLHSASLTG